VLVIYIYIYLFVRTVGVIILRGRWWRTVDPLYIYIYIYRLHNSKCQWHTYGRIVIESKSLCKDDEWYDNIVTCICMWKCAKFDNNINESDRQKRKQILFYESMSQENEKKIKKKKSRLITYLWLLYKKKRNLWILLPFICEQIYCPSTLDLYFPVYRTLTEITDE